MSLFSIVAFYEAHYIKGDVAQTERYYILNIINGRKTEVMEWQETFALKN